MDSWFTQASLFRELAAQWLPVIPCEGNEATLPGSREENDPAQDILKPSRLEGKGY